MNWLRVAELTSWRVEMSRQLPEPAADTQISIIIPTLNEATRIGDVINAARAVGACEVIVVDGGSHDATVANAAAADHVLVSAPGRATQQNLGAARATGNVLLFLHADCRLDPGAVEAVNHALQTRGVVAGCFRQRIDASGLVYRVLEAGNAARVRWLGWAYGDQALFLTRHAFDRVGGFPQMALMEDLYISKRLKRLGRIAVVDCCRVHVSARRWQRTGIIRQTCRNWLLILLAHLGVDPARLATLYPHVR